MVGGVPTPFPVQHPLAMLSVACGTSDRFSQYMREGIATHGAPSNDAPWSVVLYFDEVTCGNPLAVGDKRQVQGVYWSLYQLGMTALSDEACWFEVVAFRTKHSKTFDGSMSHVVEVVLECFFSAPHDMRTGAVFDLKGYGAVMLVLILEMIIADIKALVEVIGSNGPTAVLPCFLCKRVLSFAAKQKPAFADRPDFVDLSCLDRSKWCKHTSASMRRVVRDLAAAKDVLPDKEFKQKQTLCGFKHLARNFLLNESLAIQAVKVLCFDWMHIFFQTGNWNREVWRTLELCKAAKLPWYPQLRDYVALFHFPSRGPSLKKLMDDQHKNSCADAGYFKRQASHGLALYCVVNELFSGVVLPRAQREGRMGVELAIVSHAALCDVIDLLCMSKNGFAVVPDLLGEILETWAEAHQRAFGADLWYPKSLRACISQTCCGCERRCTQNLTCQRVGHRTC